ncbi:MAG: PepSY domain-containing protein [Colwellia sp.]|nr:PepSY domain-containing protein [Colwellia sp.]
MAKMALLRKAHKWLALIVGVQFLIWITTGLLFTLVDSEKSHGQIYRAKQNIEQAPALPEQLLTNTQLVEKIALNIAEQSIHSIQLKVFHQQWYYHLNTTTGRYLFSATTGEQFNVEENLALSLILESYQGPGKLTQLDLLTPPIAEFSHIKGRLWQAHFSDEINTTVYLEQNTGRILSHTNDTSDYNDILKMLHFMDYNDTGHFNSWWIITMAILATLLSLSGLFWLVNSHYRKFKNRFFKAA